MSSLPLPPAMPLSGPCTRGPLARIAYALLRAFGWQLYLAAPVPKRCVVVFYPHTSNWDFAIGLLAKWAIGIRFRWVAKDTLFDTPLRALFVRLGGVPVNRRERTGFIAQMKHAFDASDDFRLVIAPEGTRGRTDHWKSGFWHLALAASVPIGLAFIDYARREIGIGSFIVASGDRDRDLAALAAFYAGRKARYPNNAAPIRFRA